MVKGSELKGKTRKTVSFAYEFELELTSNSVSKIAKKNAWNDSKHFLV